MSNTLKQHIASGIVSVVAIFLTVLAQKLTGFNLLSTSGTVDLSGIFVILRSAVKLALEDSISGVLGITQ